MRRFNKSFLFNMNMGLRLCVFVMFAAACFAYPQHSLYYWTVSSPPHAGDNIVVQSFVDGNRIFRYDHKNRTITWFNSSGIIPIRQTWYANSSLSKYGEEVKRLTERINGTLHKRFIYLFF